MAHEINNSIERIVRPSALLMGAVLTAALVETGRTIADSRKSTVAGVNSHLSEEGPSIIIIPGCGQDNEYLEPLYDRHLKGLGSRHYLFQKGKEYSQKATDDGIAEACERDGDRERIFIETSMAWMEGMRSLTLPQTRAAIGKGNLRALIGLSPLTSRADLQPPMKKALEISTHTPAIPLIGDLYRSYRLLQAAKPIPHSNSISSEEAIGHYKSSARMPFRFIASEHKIIKQTKPWSPGSHAEIAEENPGLEIDQITAGYDHVVDRHVAKRHIEGSFGLPVTTLIDHRRNGHADDIEFIEPLVYAIASRSKIHEQLFASVTHLDAFRQRSRFATAS